MPAGIADGLVGPKGPEWPYGLTASSDGGVSGVVLLLDTECDALGLGVAEAEEPLEEPAEMLPRDAIEGEESDEGRGWQA